MWFSRAWTSSSCGAFIRFTGFLPFVASTTHRSARSKPRSLRHVVECGSFIEHLLHVVDPVHVPGIQGLIESSSTPEHLTHVGDLAHVPFADRLIESFSDIEHVLHAGDLAHVPLTDRSIES